MLVLFLLPFLVHSFVVHEWGTYTSCQGSNGIPMPGLHHGEVSDLPEFVHSRADTYTLEMWREARQRVQLASNDARRGIIPPTLTAGVPKDCGFCQVMDWIPVADTPSEVTQKLETPVIYFYSDDKIEEINVAVDFPKGIITEVYPQTTLNLPPVGKVKATASGHAEWNVTVYDRRTRLDVPFVQPTNIWAPSRRVTANFVESHSAAGIENEHHIFYRGLGAWDGPISVTSSMTHIFVENLGSETIPAAWVLVSDGSRRGIVRNLGPIPPFAKISTPLHQNHKFDFADPEARQMDLYLIEAGVELEVELVKAGLYPLEARAMVDTWSSSYFKNFGARVLYIAPLSYPDTVLPWKITPAPSSETRVLVGRVELLLASEEKEFTPIAKRLIAGQYGVSELQQRQADLDYLRKLGRFAEAKVRRVVEDLEVDKKTLEDWILRELTY